MRTSIINKKGKIYFTLEPDKNDIKHIETLNFSIGNEVAEIDLMGVNISEIHPDIIGLVTILLCHPFVGKELYLPLEVSPHFKDTCNDILTKYKIKSEINIELSPKKKIVDGRPGLAFSGGADSTAALIVMPGNTVPIFMKRIMKEESKYDSDAALESCKELDEVGYDIVVVESDLEYIRDPVGFPSDIANAIPAILLSEHLKLDSISFGTIMESAYGIGHKLYRNYSDTPHSRFYGAILDAAGLELSLPTAGISEVGTSIINNKAPLGNIAQSCIRGKWKNPCMRCWKCFRKEFLMAALVPLNSTPSFLEMMKSREVQKKLSEYPISHENVITYSMQKIDCSEHEYLYPLKKRLDMNLELCLLENWYSPSIKLVPKKYMNKIMNKILKYLQPMNASQELDLENWNRNEFYESKDAQKNHFNLTSSWQDI